MSDGHSGYSCPSAPCAAGSTLLGIVMPDGRVAFARDRIVASESFVEAAKDVGSPERRFRFASRCLQGACRQWSQDRCGIIDQIMKATETRPAAGPDLADCSIRSDCRWFHQVGSDACQICPMVVTDTSDISAFGQDEDQL